MKRRKLKADESLLEQYRSVRQIGSLTASECRQVVQLVRDDDRGGGTAKRPSVNHPKAFPCLRELSLREVETGSALTAWSMSLPALVQAKVDACPLYRLLMQRALHRNNNHLNLIFYQDEVSGGNILSPNQSRKSNLTYCMWLEFEVLFVEDLWLTMGVMRSREIANVEGGMAALTRAMLLQIRSETENGFVVDLGSLGEPVLCFIDSVILLMDHEAIRACTGTKGAAGLKPCIKCLNLLSLNKADAVKDHYDISCSDMEKFWPASNGSVEAARDRLMEETGKSRKQELEKLLGWNAHMLLAGPLTAAALNRWVSVKKVHFDTMHAYFSNGICGQELGCWWRHVRTHAAVTLSQLAQYAALWERCPNSPAAKQVSPQNFFEEKLWRDDRDFRGECAATALVLILCLGFSEEILADIASVQAAIRSLKALYNVICVLAEAKRNPTASRGLLTKQQMHMQYFAEAYSSQSMRPKFHYALHTTSQIEKFGRHVDCFPCERKNKGYKARAASNWSNSPLFSKGVLLELVTQDLNNSLPMEKMSLRLLKERPSTMCDPAPSSLVTEATDIEYKCVTYSREQFVRLLDGTTCCIHLFRCQGNKAHVHLKRLNPHATSRNDAAVTIWNSLPGPCVITTAEKLDKSVSPQYFRHNGDGTLSLLW